MWMMRRTPVWLAAMLPAGMASAHAVGTEPGHALQWSFEPWVVSSLSAAALWYGIGLLRLRHDAGQGRIVSLARSAAFYGGLVVLAIALMSPLDVLTDDLFSAHMVQHLLLLLAAPPLLVHGRPAIAFLWAFPLRARKRIGTLWTRLRLGRGVGWLMQPLVVWSLFSGFFIFWHLPGPYRWALQNELVHVLEHTSFFFSALMFWTIVMEPSGRRRLGYGASLVFIGSTAILSGLPGALMILAPRPLYTAQAAAAWGLTELQDQQLAGLIMWVPAGFIYVMAIAWLFVKWLGEAERRSIRLARVSMVWMLAIVLPVLLSACDGTESAVAQSGMFGGNSDRGAALIRQFGCGGCHIIPGVAGANGLVGPPLTHMARRVYLAGLLNNTPDNMVVWLMTPQRIVPGNAMPNLALSKQQARDVAAYLETLQ